MAELMYDDDDDDDSSSSAVEDGDSSVDGAELEGPRRRRRKKSRQELRDLATYGVFYEEDDEYVRPSRRRVDRGGKRPRASAPPPAFVKSRAPPPPPPPETAAEEEPPGKQPVEEEEEEEWRRRAREQQDEANQKFLALLKAGKGRAAAKQKKPPPASTPQEPPQPSLPAQFGRPAPPPPPPPRVKGSIGQWEKHTRGIGMKLLTKMGYSGSGGLVGSKRRQQRAKGKEEEEARGGAAAAAAAVQPRGIAKPVEVKLRPHQLGLGFGNFKEATRQEEPEKPAAVKKEKRDATSSSSALPSVNELLRQQSWKRGKPTKRKRTFVPVQELLEKAKPTQEIIDMRGPVETKEEEEVQAVVAQELVHNVQLLLGTYENNVQAAHAMARTCQEQVERFQTERERQQEQRRLRQERIDKLKRVLDIMNTVDNMAAACEIADEIDTTSKTKKRKVDGAIIAENVSKQLVKTLGYLEELSELFTAQERSSLGFTRQLVPALWGTVLEATWKTWRPLTDPVTAANSILRSALMVDMAAPFLEEEDEKATLQRAILIQYVLPRIQHTLKHEWDPVRDTEAGLGLYEALLKIVEECDRDAKQDGPSYDRENGTNDPEVDNNHIFSVNKSLPTDALLGGNKSTLAALVKERIIDQVVHHRLSRSLHQWKPRLDDKDEIADRLDLWILPWFPYLASSDEGAALTPLVADCKRALKSCLSVLHKSFSSDDHELFLTNSIQVLRPWRTILKAKSLHHMVSATVAPRLARYVAGKFKNLADPAQLPADVLGFVLAMHSLGLLSDIEFASIIEGEALPRWSFQLHRYMISKVVVGEGSCEVAVENYAAWKQYLFGNGKDGDERKTSSSRLLLRSDPMICRCFYGVLCMFQVDADVLGSLLPDVKTNYKEVSARRSKEAKLSAADDLMRMQEPTETREARVRLQRQHPHHTPTFREVVEEYARERDILFQPRMDGSSSFSSVDGKQVFLFGGVPIYLDSDVAFALEDGGGGDWRPTSLDALANRAIHSTS